ncbi:MAG: hypothetical protein IKH61_10875 [Bacteroidales bacterium]|nr:hypothetical protein [Bacteroidales bacterium]
MKNFRFYILLALLLMMGGTMKAQVQFESETKGANCMILAPIVNKSQIESVRYFAGDAGMVFDSSFNLVSANPKQSVQEISTIKSEHNSLIHIECIGKHFVQTHLKSFHETEDYIIHNITMYFLPSVDNIQYCELEYFVNKDIENPETIIYTVRIDETTNIGTSVLAFKGVGTCADGSRNQCVVREDGCITSLCKGENTSMVVYKEIEL